MGRCRWSRPLCPAIVAGSERLVTALLISAPGLCPTWRRALFNVINNMYNIYVWSNRSKMSLDLCMPAKCALFSIVDWDSILSSIIMRSNVLTFLVKISNLFINIELLSISLCVYGRWLSICQRLLTRTFRLSLFLIISVLCCISRISLFSYW